MYNYKQPTATRPDIDAGSVQHDQAASALAGNTMYHAHAGVERYLYTTSSTYIVVVAQEDQ